MPNDHIDATGDKDYFCTDQGFAAFLSTKFIFLGAIDTNRQLPKGGGTIKEFQFLIPKEHDMDREYSEYISGAPNTLVRANVMYNKLRLMRQACRQPIPAEQMRAS